MNQPKQQIEMTSSELNPKSRFDGEIRSTADIYNMFQKKCFVSEIKIEEDTLNLTQQDLLGLAWLKKLRVDVIDHDKSLLITVDARHRSGKSVTCAAICSLWDKTFETYFDQRIVYDPSSFLDAVDTIKREGIHGACIIVDEGSVAMGNDLFWTSMQKAINRTLAVIGYLNPIIFFLAPNRDFLDSKVRRMAHLHLKIARYNKKEAMITPYEMSINTFDGKAIFRSPKVRLFGQEITIKRIIFRKPPQVLIDRYKKMEESRKNVLLDDFKKDVQKSEIQSIKESIDIKKIISTVIERYKEYESQRSLPGKIRLSTPLILNDFGYLKSKQAEIVKETAEKRINDKLKEIESKLTELEKAKRVTQ